MVLSVKIKGNKCQVLGQYSVCDARVFFILLEHTADDTIFE